MRQNEKEADLLGNPVFMRLPEYFRWCAIQFEPAAESSIHQASPCGASHIASHDSEDASELAEVRTAWAGLPQALKAAILAIVRSQVTGCKAGA